jgi:hypothetical protein
MAYVTYKNRTSENYRFTTDTLDDPAIADLKALLEYNNGFVKRARKTYPNSYYALKDTYGIRIRARGPRTKAVGIFPSYYDTPMENATRYDVYIRKN